MPYATEARILHGACRSHMEALVTRLHDVGCVTRIERERRVMVLEVPEDDVSWILTGGLAELLSDYADCLAWRPRFREHRRPLASLPAPRAEVLQLTRTT